MIREWFELCGMDYWPSDASSADQMCVAQGTTPTAAQAGRPLLEETSALFVSTTIFPLTVVNSSHVELWALHHHHLRKSSTLPFFIGTFQSQHIIYHLGCKVSTCYIPPNYLLCWKKKIQRECDSCRPDLNIYSQSFAEHNHPHS